MAINLSSMFKVKAITPQQEEELMKELMAEMPFRQLSVFHSEGNGKYKGTLFPFLPKFEYSSQAKKGAIKYLSKTYYLTVEWQKGILNDAQVWAITELKNNPEYQTQDTVHSISKLYFLTEEETEEYINSLTDPDLIAFYKAVNIKHKAQAKPNAQEWEELPE